MNNSNSRKIAQTAILLAICVVSQFFKNLSVFITGPIINLCIIICVLLVGLRWGALICIISPITSFIITGSPIMAAIPAIIPAVIVGNIVMAGGVALGVKMIKGKFGLPLSLVIGSILKAIFMGIVISLILVPLCLPEAMHKQMPVIQSTFSVVQLITALIGSVLAYIIYFPLRKAIGNNK